MRKDGNKNASILSFFRPVPSSQASPPRPSASQAPSPQQTSHPTPSSPLRLPSSPQVESTPAKPIHFSRNAVIRGSDDEAEDSDDSLPDIFAIAKKMSPAPPPRREQNLCVTPKAKRTALEFHSSPLTIMPKHKFDLKSLLSHAEKDSAAEASAQRLSELIEKGKAAQTDGETEDAPKKETKSDDAAAGNEEEPGANFKLARALERSEVAATHKQYHFFDSNTPEPSSLAGRPFPRTAAKGSWSMLQDSKSRQSTFLAGLPFTVQSRRQDLPDEIFLWILDELCFEKSEPLLNEYLRVLSVCPLNVQRLLDLERIILLFAHLGSGDNSDLLSPLPLTAELRHYPHRHWSNLKAVIGLLAGVANELDLKALTAATEVLLRLGVDQLVMENIDVLTEYQSALESLASAVPASHWNDFCEDVCTSLFNGVKAPILRLQPLSCFAANTPRVHELRRRLAAVSFFDELHWAHERPRDSISISSIIERFEHESLVIDAKTDYRELNALIKLLDITVDDGSRWSFTTAEAKAEFNAGVDKLCKKLKILLSKIDANRGMHSSRIDAKTTIEWVLERLTHSVRTKPPPKVSILDIPQEKEDPFLPRQQAYMRKFCLPKKGDGTKDGAQI